MTSVWADQASGALWCFGEKPVRRKGCGIRVRGEVCVLIDVIIEAKNKG